MFFVIFQGQDFHQGAFRPGVTVAVVCDAGNAKPLAALEKSPNAFFTDLNQSPGR
jgi:hypothetical protein